MAKAVTCDETGLAEFEVLRSRRGDVHLCAFDLLELDGHDLRLEPLAERRRLLGRLVRKPRGGLVLNAQFEQDGPLVFERACLLGCEGIVSKRKTSRYRSGRSRDWVKSKNPAAPAVRREAEEDWGNMFVTSKLELFTALATIAIALFTGTLWWSTRLLWRTARDAANRQEKDTKILQRAYLSVQPHGVHVLRDREICVAHIDICNIYPLGKQDGRSATDSAPMAV
jgi:ATP dependent DNA ligase-like protein